MRTGGDGSELVMHAARLVRMVGRAAAHDSPASLRLLSQLDELGPLSVTDLARADRTSQPTTSAAVRALEKHRLVTRRPNPDDGRSSLVTLTEAGRAELAAARRTHARLVRGLLAERGVEDADVATAVRVLKILTTSSHLLTT